MFLARHNMSYPHLSSSFTVGNNLYSLNGKIPYFLYLPRKRLNGKSIVFFLCYYFIFSSSVRSYLTEKTTSKLSRSKKCEILSYVYIGLYVEFQLFLSHF